MTVASVAIDELEQPLADQTWRFVAGAIQVVSGLVLRLTDRDGRVGYGYSRVSPPPGTTMAAARARLVELTKDLPGRDEADLNAIIDDLDRRFPGHERLKSAIECALFDLRAKAIGVPLGGLFGGRRRESIPQMRIIPLKSPEQMAEVGASLVAEGYGFLKVKASGDPDLDVARVRAVRERVGTGIRLMIDANESYQPDAAIGSIRRMVEYGIELVEQPTPAGDIEGLHRVARSVPVPVEADESAQTLPEILRLAAGRMVASINLRILNLGGIRTTMAAVAVCEAAGIGYRFGASFGPRLLQAQTAHVASVVPHLGFAQELAEFNHILDDPFAGFEVVGGMVEVPGAAGSGVTYDAR